ncbi:MAG: 50S ribosomal protein L23 [Proteobacteria bacterium]|nr:50S ribosomal protein L23 [Pseudomonadota bacterium]
MNMFEVIKRPLVTEKSTMAQEDNKYTFDVSLKATKADIRRAVEGVFKVTVEEVRTISMPAKYKRVGKNMGKLSPWKKAIVRLKEGDRIEFMEGA